MLTIYFEDLDVGSVYLGRECVCDKEEMLSSADAMTPGLLFGNDDLEEREDGLRRSYVGAKMLAPDGGLALRYHKIRLVPFGEYVPLRPLFRLAGAGAPKLVQQVADFTPSASATLGEADGHRLGATICFEAIFPDLVRRFAAGGAELLVNLTNDAWYGRTSAPYQHFAMARLRAVENGRYLVRAANTGISAVVDPRGRVAARRPTLRVQDAAGCAQGSRAHLAGMDRRRVGPQPPAHPAVRGRIGVHRDFST